MKNEKIGLTAFNWILSILGIILLSCFIILPPLFRTIFKEEAPKEELKTEIVIKTLTCRKQNIITENYTDNDTLTFRYYNDSIRTYSREINRVYNDFTVYSTDKQLHGRYVSAFSILPGYDYSIQPDDNSQSIIINENYDLGLFKETTITIPGDTTETIVTSLYSMEDSVIEIHTNLINDGYTCE